MGEMKFNVLIHTEEDGGYSVEVPALDGCFTQGETMEEAIENAKEAIHCYIEGLQMLNHIKTDTRAEVKELEIIF